MSSYRSYVPWKTTLSPSTYKSGSGSNYSSRDDVSTTSDSKPSASSTPRFGSIASPAAYRPSYSGGTYRSVPIKRDTGLSSYTTRYTTTPTASTPVTTSTTSSTTPGTPSSVTSAKEEKTKSSSSESSKKTSSKYSTKDASAKKSSSKYTTSGKDSSSTSESRLSRLSTSTSNLSKYGRTSRDPSPATTNLSSTSKYSRKSREPSPITTTLTSSGKYTRKSSRDPSPVTSTLTSTSKYVKKSRDPSPLTTTLTAKYGRQSRDTSPVNSSTSTSTASNLTRYRAASRDPSPGERKSSLALARGRSRDPSPLITTTLRGRSRDPSPAESLKERISSATSGYSSSYRLFPKSSSGYSSKYDTNSALTRTSMPDKALSYMSSSDIRARSVGRQRERVEKESKSSASESTEVVAAKSEESRSELETTQETTESEESDENESFVSVTVVTRGTSPTPPNSTTVVRNRRTDLAKTIEKTIQKSTKKRHLVDKEIQSDRLDDPTRYSRFSGTSRTTSIPWSSYLDTKFSGSSASSRYSPSKTSRDSTSKSETDSSEKKKKTDVERLKKDELSSSKESISLSRSNSSRSISKLGKSSTPESKTKSSKSSSGQKQKSPESPTATSNLVSRALPPTVPKTEVPTKPGSASSVSNVKWPNKDFRKSALNVGPTDRPRKSRTPSTSTDTDEKNDQTASKSSSPLVKTPASLERSPSVASEASSNGNSATSSSLSEDEQKRSPPTNANAKTSQALASQFLDEDISLPKDKTVNSYYKTSPNVTSSSGASKNKQAINARQTSTPTLSSTNIRTESPAPVATKIDEAKSYLIRKLGSVSNIFIRNEDSSGETVYLDNTSSSLSNETKENATNAANAAVSVTATISLPKRVNPELSTTVNISNHTKSPTPNPISSNSKSDQDLEDSSWWQNTSQQIDTESALDLRDDMKYKLRHIDSGELAWWNRNDEDETIAEDIKTYQDDPDRSENTDPSSLYINNNTNSTSKHSNDKQWSITINDNNEPINIDNATQSSGNSNKLMPNKIRHIQSGELPWWLTENCIEGVQDLTLNETTNRSNKTHSNSPKNLSPKDYLSPEKSPSNRSLYKIRHNQSGEKAWWLNDSKSNSPTTETNQRSTPSREKNWWVNGTINETKGSPQRENYNSPTASKKQYKIRHVESGEKAWWMQDDSSERQQPQQQPALIEENEYPNQMQYEEEEERVADDQEIQNVTMNLKNYKNYNPPSHHDYFALGDRASPEGLEDTTAGRKSPYDNIPGGTTVPQQQQFQPNRSDAAHQLFISRHKNIDELLGGSCRPLSPLMDRFSGRNMFIEEVTPEQVRIHDSTPQIAVIQRMERDPWEFDFNAHLLQNQNQQMLDDAAIQVYKDGDYGAYLDLESSLAEQAEEIEGLNSSRKNSLVVRTQLSVRVHAIIEKLLSSEGSELRRALFSLKQIFQEDKDLVHGFVALGGLNCLVRVGNGADQNYQNYILRALGQVMLYVDGMNGVMKHGPTIQWLYSLIASKYRLVVKTALKLLLVFVEYTESNCYLLVNAIHAVDKIHGTVPWSNIMKLLKDYENADTELLIYATSLINKTLSGLSDQDSFYDESDHLEQQGMEGVIQRYMSRPGTDLDLLDQLQLYEAVLKFEDGESDGIHRIHDNSIRKTLRYRSTDSTERRKSRRHSTGTSPMSQNMSTQKRYTPPVGQVLDEDSSSSNNSNEFNAFRDSKGSSQREGAGVTPGLRRRRERAERQKTFMREQQEAAANGIRSPFEKRDDLNGLGQIVTAVPVHLQNGSDSPPESLNPTINTDKTHHNNHRHMNNSNDNHSIPSKTVYSPTKAVLTNTNISVISNGFDKKATNNTNNLSCDKPANTNTNGSVTNGMMSKRHGSDYASNKSHAMRTNSANVINGLMKNINRNDPNDNNNYSSHKKFEHDANRLNSFYNQLSSTKNNNYTGSKLSHKNLNTPTSNGTNSTTKNTSNGRIPVKHKDPVQTQASLNQNSVTNGSQNLSSDTVITNGNGNNHAISNGTNGNCPLTDSADSDSENKRSLLQLKKDQTVKDITQKLTNLPMSPQEEKPQSRLGDMTGLISKAKEGLAKSKSKGEISRSPSTEQEIKKAEPKKSENELHWEELVRSLSRPLNLCDLDFTDLNSEDEKDVLAPRSLGGPVPPPPPPIGMPPPPMAGMCPPPPFNGMAPPPGAFPPPLSNLVPPPCFNFNQLNKANGEVNSSTIKKNKKTVKLFWKEVREDMIPPTVGKTIWDELPDSAVDTQKLEHLFESRAKDLMTKKQQELNKNKEIIVLDHKRSNAINIAMTKLPPPRAIKAAILKMDATVVTREGIDKLLNMLPTDEERGKIQEAQMSNPELPLGSAEQFLLTLSSISELAARLKLWAFKLDFENSEREIAEPLMDLKQGLELLKANKTFKCILSTLLSIGIFLNGAPVKGFQIEYLSKVPEVKDTVHKHSLLHHLCHMVMETSPDTTDLYSEIGPITRASKADFTELAHSLIQLETECKSSWDRLKLIAKHDCPTQLKQKLVDFLADCAERIIILQIVHRRVINRYRKFLLWLGIPLHRIPESKPNEFCRIVSEFALEYRTTRERVQQQIEKKANHRERNKTRGKMIIDVAKFRTQEDRADAELKQLLGSPNPGTENTDGTLTWRRRRAENLRSPIIKQNEESFTDGDDEILESLVKTATKASGPRPTPRERKRTRHADRKSLKRSRTREGFTFERVAASPEH